MLALYNMAIKASSGDHTPQRNSRRLRDGNACHNRFSLSVGLPKVKMQRPREGQIIHTISRIGQTPFFSHGFLVS